MRWPLRSRAPNSPARSVGFRPASPPPARPFARRFYSVGDDTGPATLRAPFSYVVRYHRPAADKAAFIENHLATHPATQAKLPGIRAIMCYLPLDDLPGSAWTMVRAPCRRRTA